MKLKFYYIYVRRYVKRTVYLGIQHRVPKGVLESWQKLSWVFQFYALQAPELKPHSFQPRTQFILIGLVLGYRVFQHYCYSHELHGLEVYFTPMFGLGSSLCFTFYFGKYTYRCLFGIFRTSFRLFKTIKESYGFSSMVVYGVVGTLLQFLRVLVSSVLMGFFFCVAINVLYLTAFGFTPTQELYKYWLGEQEWDEFWKRLRYPASYKRYVFVQGRPRLSTFDELGEDPKRPGN